MRAQILFMLAVAGVGIVSGIHETSFNNYLSEIFTIGASTRGFLELPRELPGLLAVFIAGALISFGQVKVAVISMLCVALGFIGLGFLSANFGIMVLWLMLWSIGNHLFMPLEGSIAVSLSEKDSIGKVLGRLGAIRLGATVIGAGIIWLALGDLLTNPLTYRHTYGIAAIVAVLAAVALMKTGAIPVHGKQPKLIWKTEYRLYYILSILWGVRKQVFITFAPWLLVQTFHQPASIIAQLWIVTSLLGVFFRPLLGKWSDSFGERRVMTGESPIVLVIFLGYALAPILGLGSWGLWIVFGCYVADSLLMAMPMVRTSYLSKVLIDKNDLAPTLAMGVSLDHASSMIMPFVGGLLWSRFGSQYLFAFGMIFVVVNFLFARHVTTNLDHSKTRPPHVVEA